MDSAKRVLRVDQSVDARSSEGPSVYQRAVETLQTMAEEDVLELLIDEGEPLRTIPFALRAEGHEILISEPAQPGVRLLVRKRSLLT
ncbi:MAG: sulfurtransferase TusA family protein [Candidatus Omnitrophica bacterium]|nr:sulfurtransferase TusA family protein [Candidatus Omnitrophota bacterium]